MIFAQIQSGTIINLVEAQTNDPKDAAFVWVDMTNYDPQPQIGWTTSDNVNFVSNIPPITLPQAMQANLGEFQGAVQALVDAHYSLEIRFNFMALYQLALVNNLPNRATYIAQLFTWAQSVVTYAATYMATVQAMTSVAQVQASTWDFTQIAADPMVTSQAAIQINN